VGSVVIDMSMSLDGYIAAPNDIPGQGLGEDGMRLHNWAFDDPSVFEQVFGNLIEETGAVIMGRRSYDNSIEEWEGKGPLGEVPCFVVTHRPLQDADPVFTFVIDGIEVALAKARAAAGDKRIGLMGANIDQQFLAAGLVDEIRIHLVNVLLGGGRRLFDVLPQRVELEQTGLMERHQGRPKSRPGGSCTRPGASIERCTDSAGAASCGRPRASVAGGRCASRPSGGSRGVNAPSSSATSRTARTSSRSP
jgi:dihydrofolate reductase